ncbi:cyclin-domain-containing protein [Sphaerosporella brunnea]|uniref:Cyclin-domain-containing protein n=2 Tax=Sphaerosporella brunnea TaxID=1250544 RepID=A0A5J5EKK3_9PEZI|nr:cyclin-domain-containing protein [Sphaerosporella brunnea]
MTSPFASPPPPYSPEHPHIILDHEKLSTAMTDLPPQLPSDSPKPRGLRGKDGDIFHLAPSAALTLLARYVELLVSITGDIPPTPPLSTSTTPGGDQCSSPCSARSKSSERRKSGASHYFCAAATAEGVDGVRIKAPITPPDSESDECEGTSIIHHGGVDDRMHYGTIARKFWSKAAPEIPIEEYLFRIHRFCPLSTAVYLAASFYLHRIAVIGRIVPLTRLNAHRLVLAALRVAAKTLEDLSYAQSRFAKVGGLNDLELSRLEVSFCFLMDFELKVDRAMLESHVEVLRNSVEAQVMMGKDGLVLIRTPT